MKERNKMSHSLDYALDGQGNQVYGVNPSGDQVYRVTEDSYKIFAVRHDKPYYARDHAGNEKYPQIKGADVAIPLEKLYYVVDKHGNQVYPKTKDGDEIPFFYKTASGRSQVQYAYAKDKTHYYPKNEDGDDVAYHGTYIRNAGKSIYPWDKNGDPILPRSRKVGQWYLVNSDGSTQVPLRRDGTPVYAKEKLTPNGPEQEYYPEDGTIGYHKDGSAVYATTVAGDILFPDGPEGEYYLKRKNSQSDSFQYGNGQWIQRYAENHLNSQVYPQQVTSQGETKEVCLANRYAVAADGRAMYPLDEFGNEYTLDDADWKKVLPIGYPITHDNWVIVPSMNQKPLLRDEVSPQVKETNLIALLYREGRGYVDYYTNVRAARVSRSKRHPKSLKLLPIPKAGLAAKPSSSMPPSRRRPKTQLAISLMIMVAIIVLVSVLTMLGVASWN